MIIFLHYNFYYVAAGYLKYETSFNEHGHVISLILEVEFGVLVLL